MTKAERRDERRRKKRAKAERKSNRKALRVIEGFVFGWMTPRSRRGRQ